MTADTRHVMRCPVCGRVLGEATADGRASFWRVCPNCHALSRYDLPDGRWTVERVPRGRR